MIKLRAFVTGLYYGVYITYTIYALWQAYRLKKMMEASRHRMMEDKGVPSMEDLGVGVRDYPHPGEE